MLSITCQYTAKHYGRHVLLKPFSYQFSGYGTYVFTGANGAGKSTLLSLIMGYVAPSEGSISRIREEKSLHLAAFHRISCWIAPDLQLIASYTLRDFLTFYRRFKTLTLDNDAFSAATDLPLTGRTLGEFSKGMQQKVKLGLAFYSTASCLLLDEPTVNLDGQNKQWYRQQLLQVAGQRMLLIASNEEQEYQFLAEKQLFRIAQSEVRPYA